MTAMRSFLRLTFCNIKNYVHIIRGQFHKELRLIVTLLNKRFSIQLQFISLSLLLTGS